jgi:hypothetical protein
LRSGSITYPIISFVGVVLLLAGQRLRSRI